MAEPKVSVLLTLVDRVTQPMNGIRGSLSGAAKAIGTAFAAIGGAVAAGAFLKGAIEESLEAERVMARLRTAVTNTGQSFDEDFREQAERTVASVQKLSTASDDELRDALARMITISGDSAGSLKNLQLATDFASASGKDLGKAAEIVGKAMAGNLESLKEFGVSAKTSDAALQQLREKVTGFAAQDAQTFGGQLKLLKNGWDDFKESVGNAILSNQSMGQGVGLLTGLLAKLAGWIEANEGAISAFIQRGVELGRAIWDGAKPLVELLLPALKLVWEAWQRVNDVVMYVVRFAPAAIQQFVGQVLERLGVFAEGVEHLAGKVGLHFDLMGSEMKETGAKWARDGKTAVANAEGAWRDAMGRIEAAGERHEKSLTGTAEKGGSTRVRLTAEQQAAIEKQRAASAKALEELEKDAAKSSLALLSATEKEYLEAVDKFQGKMADMTASDRQAAEGLLQRHLGNLLLKWAMFDAAMDRRVPAIRDSTEYIEIQGKSVDELRDALGRYSGKALEVATADEARNVQREVVRAKIAEVAFAYEDAAGEMQGFLDVLGASDEDTQAFLTGIGNIADGIGKLALGDVVGGVQSGLAGIASFAKLAFGNESASAKAIRSALERTQGSLEEHRRTLGDLIDISRPGAQLGGIEAALGGIDFGRFSKDEKARTVNDKALQQLLGRELLGRGLSMADLDEVAKAFGQEIRDDKGRLSAELLQRLFDLLSATETGFAQTFGGQLDRIKQGKEVGVVTDEFGEILKLITDPKLGIPAIASALNAAGPDASSRVSALQNLFKQLDTPGAISKAALGGASEAEFRAVIKQLIELLGAGATGAVPPAAEPAAPAAPAEPAAAPAGPVISAPSATLPAAEAADFAGLLEASAMTAEHTAKTAQHSAATVKALVEIQRILATDRASTATAEQLNEALAVLYQRDLDLLGSVERAA